MDTEERDPHGLRYPPDVKELAYQLWALRTGRNASEVSRLLATPEYGSLAVERRSISRWVDTEHWVQRAEADMEELAPGMLRQTYSNLVLSALDGSARLRRHNAGDIKLDKVDAQIAIASVHAVGFSPVGNRDPTQSLPATTKRVLELADLANLSPEELAGIEASYRSRKLKP